MVILETDKENLHLLKFSSSSSSFQIAQGFDRENAFCYQQSNFRATHRGRVHCCGGQRRPERGRKASAAFERRLHGQKVRERLQPRRTEDSRGWRGWI